MDSYTYNAIISTPKPSATSTVDKRLVQRNIEKEMAELQCSSSAQEDSLGLVSIQSASTLDGQYVKKGYEYSDEAISERLEFLHKLAYKTIGKPNELPSRFLNPSDLKNNTEFHTSSNSGSTISESDFLRETSTPKSKYADGSMSTKDISSLLDETNNPFYRKSTLSSGESLVKRIEEQCNLFRNSDVSVRDICRRFSTSKQSISQSLSSDMFTPAELAVDEMRERELSWRKAKDIPVPKEIRESTFSEINLEETGKYSVGDYFCKRNPDIHIFDNKSPEKCDPEPLYESSYLSEEPVRESGVYQKDDSYRYDSVREQSMFTVSQIRKLLSDHHFDSPRIIEYLTNKQPEKPIIKVSSAESMLNNTDVNKKSFDFESVEVPSESNVQMSIGSKLTNDFVPPHYSTFAEQEDSISKDHVDSKKLTPILSSSNCQSVNSKTFISPTSTTKSPASPCTQKGYQISRSYTSMSNSAGEKFSPAADKENIQHINLSVKMNNMKQQKSLTPESEADRSMSSVRSGSTMDTLIGGKLPIETTRNELIWGCVKVGKSVFQKFLLRSKSHKKIRFQLCITGNAFKIAKTETEHISSYTALLHPLETKSFTIVFSPPANGVFVDKLSFVPIGTSEQSSVKQNLKLYGYGGQASIELKNISKDPSGKSWLSLGYLENKPVILEEIILKNNGTLPAFSYIQFVPKYQYKFSTIKVNPSKMILHPNDEVRVSIQYSPTKEDFKEISGSAEVVEIGHLKLISAEEPTRARIRRLCRKAKQANHVVDKLIEELSSEFANEIHLDNMHKFTETIGAMKELSHQILFKDVILTVEQDPNKTVVAVDDSSMFGTLCFNNSNSLLDSTVINKYHTNLCTVLPTVVILTPPVKLMDTVLLSSNSLTPLRFQIAIEPSVELQVQPIEGIVSNDRTVVIKISCNNTISTELFKLKVYVENEVLDITIKVVYVEKEGFKL